MARPKLIDDNKAIDLIKKYFNEECNGEIRKLKTTDIVMYINRHGYPAYNAVALRRSPVLMKYIEDLKNTINDDSYVTAVSYQTIDAAYLLDKHRTRDSLIKVITERDSYYKTIADAAAQSFERYNALSKKYDEKKSKVRELETELSIKDEELINAKESIRQLKKELKAYKDIVDTYVYPEIANELLVREGAIRKTREILDPDAVLKNIISTETNIRKGMITESNVINSMFL